MAAEILRELLNSNEKKQWHIATKLVETGKFSKEDLNINVSGWGSIIHWSVFEFYNSQLRSIPSTVTYQDVFNFIQSVRSAGVDIRTPTKNGDTVFIMSLEYGLYELSQMLYPFFGFSDYVNLKDLESGTLFNIFCGSVGKRNKADTKKMLAWLLKLKGEDGKLINIKRKSTWGNDPINQLKNYNLLGKRVTPEEKTAFAVKEILEFVWDFYEDPL